LFGLQHALEETLERVPSREARSIGEVLEIDRESRAKARDVVRRITQSAPAQDRSGELYVKA